MSEIPAAGYYRVSDLDADPEAKDPEEDLRKKIWYQRDWAVAEARRRALVLVKEYEERHTGMESERPKMKEMLGDIRRLGVKFVLIFSDDRLARDDIVARELIARIEREGASVVLGNLNMESMTDLVDRELMMTVKFAVTKWERGKIVQRLSRGAKHAREEGTLFNEVPRHFVQDEYGVVRPHADAFDMRARRARGETFRDIAAAYNTYERDIRRTIDRVEEWERRPPGIEWRRGKKVIRALREQRATSEGDLTASTDSENDTVPP